MHEHVRARIHEASKHTYAIRATIGTYISDRRLLVRRFYHIQLLKRKHMQSTRLYMHIGVAQGIVA